MQDFGFSVHNINEHHQAELVDLINKSLQLVWSAKSAAGLQERARQMVFGACFVVVGAQCQ